MPTLHWLTRDEDIGVAGRAPYRLLEEAPGLSAGAADAEGMLIQDDNLEGLKALLPFHAGGVKCVCIDPPYNTRAAFEHFDDNLEHARWLAMMWPRLELLRDLLAEDGSIWVSIDDREGHYLKVIMDEIFGRKNFVDTVIWRKNFSPKSSARHFSSDHDYILVFSKNLDEFQPNLMPRTERHNKAYKNPDNDLRGPWSSSDVSARNFYSHGRYSVTTPGGRIIEGPPAGMYWRVSEEKFWNMHRDGRIWWGKKGNTIPRIKRFLSEVKQGIVPQTLWGYEDVGHTIDIDGKRVDYRFTGEDAAPAFDGAVEGWTPEALVRWLEWRVRAIDIGQNDLIEWLSGLIRHLTVARGLSVAALMRCRALLAHRVRARIDAIRRAERTRAFRRHLFGPEAKPAVSFDDALAFRFRDGMYRGEPLYRGRWKPTRHFLGPDAVPAFDGADDGEEAGCARALDSLPGVRHWIRNVARCPDSFRLPLASGWFYPDFAAALEDGRLLIVEYKGAHLADSGDTAAKRAVGELWERASAGRGLFVMAEKSVSGKDARRQLADRIAA